MTQKFSRTQGVLFLSFIQFLERFGFFGFTALAVLYATTENGLNLEWEFTNNLYSMLFPLLALSAVIMGFLSDKFLKQMKGLQIGGGLLMLAYGLFIFKNFWVLGFAFFLLIMGSGLFRTNLIVLMGRLFEKSDRNRVKGFIVHALATNIGVFLGTMLLGMMSDRYGFEWCFGFVAVLLLLAQLLFLFFKGRLNFLELETSTATNTLSSNYEGILDSGIFENESKTSSISNLSKNRWGFFLLLFTLALFVWATYGLIQTATIDILPKEHFFRMAVFSFIVLINLVFLIYWSIKKIGNNIPLFAFALLPLGLIAFLVSEVITPLYNLHFSITISTFFLLAVVEFVFSTVLLSYITQVSSIKYASTTVGLYLMTLPLVPLLEKLFQALMLGDSLFLILGSIAIIIGLVIFGTKKALKRMSGGVG